MNEVNAKLKRLSMYLEFEDGDAATDPRTPPLREPPPPDAGFRCRAEEERSDGGSPSPYRKGKKTQPTNLRFITSQRSQLTRKPQQKRS